MYIHRYVYIYLYIYIYVCMDNIYIYIYQGCDFSSYWRTFSPNGNIMEIRRFYFKKNVKNKTKICVLKWIKYSHLAI